MHKSRFTTEQIIGFIKQAGAGMAGLTCATSMASARPGLCQWRTKHDDREAENAERLKAQAFGAIRGCGAGR